MDIRSSASWRKKQLRINRTGRTLNTMRLNTWSRSDPYDHIGQHHLNNIPNPSTNFTIPKLTAVILGKNQPISIEPHDILFVTYRKRVYVEMGVNGVGKESVNEFVDSQRRRRGEGKKILHLVISRDLKIEILRRGSTSAREIRLYMSKSSSSKKKKKTTVYKDVRCLHLQ